MPRITIDPTGFSIGTEKEDIALLADLVQRFKGLFQKTEYVDYSPERSAEAYQDSNISFVQTPDRQVRAPYELIVDYRKWPAEQALWGTVEFGDAYRFPDALSGHCAAMIKRFVAEGRLAKGNQPAPRVLRCEANNNIPHFVLQQAFYYDQVGSNLTIDMPLPSTITVGDVECRCVREWDVAKEFGKERKLPSFEQSRLANTIGVAVGITATSKDGRTHWLRRMRSEKVAVYSRMWHLPLTFALALTDEWSAALDLNTLIGFDLLVERTEELGLEHNDFGPLTPVAFCRDLARGGKPQFFFELPIQISIEDLERKIGKSSYEYKGSIEPVTYDDDRTGFSPELICFLLLKSGFGCAEPSRTMQS